MAQTWSFNGTDLSSFGAITVLDDSLDIPDRRGENIIIPFRHGRTHIAKYFDERKLLIGLTINDTSASAIQTKLDNLRKLIGVRTEKTLSVTLDDATVRTAQASVNKNLQTAHIHNGGRLALRVVLEFTMADPFFRSNVLLTGSATINASPKALVINNTGAFEEREATITLDGPLTNPVITNSTNGVSMTYTGVISGGEQVVISVNGMGEYIALKDGVTDVIDNITHEGSSAFMLLDAGSNSLSITSDVTTTGAVTIEFYPPFL